MKERPIPFSGAMVRAILAGKKTQTRRLNGLDEFNEAPDVFEAFPGAAESFCFYHKADGSNYFLKCPYGKPGDRLWVRETFFIDERNAKGKAPQEVIFDATPEWAINHKGELERVRFLGGEIVSPEVARASIDTNKFWHKRPSIFMPRWACRITLEVTEVRVERLNQITETDAIAEGAEPWPFCAEQPMTTGELGADSPYRGGYAVLWDEINDHRATWKSNPWVWAVSSKKITEVSR